LLAERPDDLAGANLLVLDHLKPLVGAGAPFSIRTHDLYSQVLKIG
jgi:hypothetical protein